MNKDNQPETIEIDDEVRQADYKYTYNDSSNTVLKSEQADMLVGAVEKFAQQIPLNLEEIFCWYFEQKGVDNPERFLGAGVNNGVNNNPQINPELLQMLLQGFMQAPKIEQNSKEEDSKTSEENTKEEESDGSSLFKIFQELVK